MQGVWASKYNERALLSMRKVGLDFRDLRMAVLVQRVVPAAYAFVIHTHNPSTGSPDEVRASQTTTTRLIARGESDLRARLSTAPWTFGF